MNILIVTPLFPPDTAPAACYVKTLTERLQHTNQVTTLLYGHLPEVAGGANLVSVDKRLGRIQRAICFVRRLWQLARCHDLILIQNGPSVELPSLLVLPFVRADVVVMESDTAALTATHHNPFLRLVHFLLTTRATWQYRTTDTWPSARPLIHPLKPRPEQELATWEQSWQQHLEAIFTHRIPS